jgi:amino acid transporter
MSIGARVAYTMGRDKEVPEHFGILHGERLTPHQAIWTVAVISVITAIASILFTFCGPAALNDDVVKALPNNFWYSFGIFQHDLAVKIPQSLVVVTLVSNFGTFLLYMMTCIVAMVAFHEHHTFNSFKHLFIPMFGVLANLICMLFYVIGPLMVAGMSPKEPLIALSTCALWGLYWSIFIRSGRKSV